MIVLKVDWEFCFPATWQHLVKTIVWNFGGEVVGREGEVFMACVPTGVTQRVRLPLGIKPRYWAWGAFTC